MSQTPGPLSSLQSWNIRTIVSLIVLGIVASLWFSLLGNTDEIPPGRRRVVFWHFWGGAERDVVREIVRRFNESQAEHWVVEVPIPGQNLDMKFYMSVAGGDFPDVMNQDDQIVAQWAARDVLLPIRELTDDESEYAALQEWLFPAAQRIGTYDGELYALCNALDVRTMFYRGSALNGASPPVTLQQFDAVARGSADDTTIPYLPDDRRLWAWGIAFGGDFYDEERRLVTTDDPRIVEALEWMTSYTELHGLEKIRAFRSTNREAGAGSMLLDGRYEMMMDGQWRVPQLDDAVDELGQAFDYDVAPLPYPPGGRDKAGWVNGNFFVVPRGCENPDGAWAFMKFWSGFGGNEREAAKTAAAGGWIPAGQAVVETVPFQNFLEQHPRFRLFVELAAGPHQFPTPAVPVQAYFYERVNRAAEAALTLQETPQEALKAAREDIQRQLDSTISGR